jgi:hypothetical protein
MSLAVLLGFNRTDREFAGRHRPGLLAGTTNVPERALPALHRHFDGGGTAATVWTCQSEFRFGFRMHESLAPEEKNGDDKTVTTFNGRGSSTLAYEPFIAPSMRCSRAAVTPRYKQSLRDLRPYGAAAVVAVPSSG